MNAMAADATTALAPDLWMTLLKSFAVLCLVLGLVLALLFLLRRFALHPGRLGGNSVMKTLAIHHVGPKERVMLMEVMGERILIGVTAQQINYLTTIRNYELGIRNDGSGGRT